MTARRHHFVPQCYLRGFAKDRQVEQLLAVDLNTKRAFYPTTKNVAVELDFHRIDSAGVPPDELENRLANLDSELAAALVGLAPNLRPFEIVGQVCRLIRGLDPFVTPAGVVRFMA